ncbi:MAG: NTP transferase domain-containing protein [Methanolinea sp.]|nr:NTP transferase domain-containing protein [Methanolinea sp.]
MGMYALILAGGQGSRLGQGEKPLVLVEGVPMVQRVIDAFEGEGHDIVVVLSPRTPYTHNWCRARGILHYTAEGRGYMEDIIETVHALDIRSPFFSSVADIPLLSGDIIRRIREAYEKSGKDALSTWIPAALAEEHGCHPSLAEVVSGTLACPAGINILRGDLIDTPQDEVQIIIDDPRLACNINTREALERVMARLKEKPAGKKSP